MKVLLEEGVWLAGWPSVCNGDPCRTLEKDNAYEFDTIEQAMQALKEARSFRPFESAQIMEDFV